MVYKRKLTSVANVSTLCALLVGITWRAPQATPARFKAGKQVFQRNQQETITVRLETKLELPKSLTALAKEEIGAAIIDGRLAFGQHLSEGALAANLGISKTPVREALLQLKLEGLVEIEPRRGTFVFKLTEEQVREICRFRQVIETAALGLALDRDRDLLVRRLTSVCDSSASSRADENLARQLDMQFHEAILECCRNEYLQSAYNLIASKIQALRARLPREDEHVAACRDDHAAILSLVRSGQASAALKRLRAHIKNTEDSYLAANRQFAADIAMPMAQVS
jgi:DNA-binding GntR family transcriptional regulator